MKALFTAIVTVLALSSCFSSHYYGPKIEREYALNSFNAILGSGVGGIEFTQGSIFTVRAEGDSVQIENSVVEVKDGKLIIGRKPGSEKIGNESVTYYVTAPTLTKIEMQGVMAFEAKEPITLENDVVIDLDGVGAVKMSNLTCNNLNINNKGVGAIDLTTTCQDATCALTGVGAIDLTIEGESLTLMSEGVGAVQVSGHVKNYNKNNHVTSAVDDDKLKVDNK